MLNKLSLTVLGLLLLGACGQTASDQTSLFRAPNALTAAALAPCETCTWQDLGPQPLDVRPEDFSDASTLTLAGSRPVVAWNDHNGPESSAFVREFEGADWSVPVRLNSAGSEGLLPALASNAAGATAVSFLQATPDGRAVIRLKRRVVRNGVPTWQPLDPQSDAGISHGGRAYESSLTLHPDGTPYLAWSEVVGNTFKIYVWRYRNAMWQSLGSGADGSVDSGYAPRIVINANGLALAYLQNGVGGPRLAVRRWNGSALQPVASPSTLSVGGYSLALDSGGAIMVALSEYRNGTQDLSVKRRSGGGSWVTLGGPLDLSPAANALQPSLTVTPEQVAVVWREDGGLFMKRWNPATNTWTPVAGRLNPDGQGARPTLALTPAGEAIVSFDQGEHNLTDVRVRHLAP